MSKWRNFHCEEFEEGERVIGWCICDDGSGMIAMIFHRSGGWWFDGEKDSAAHPALWHPLPDDPYINDTRGDGGPKNDGDEV